MNMSISMLMLRYLLFCVVAHASLCADYCTVVSIACPAVYSSPTVESNILCSLVCSMWTPALSGDPDSESMGDSVACRLYHARLAAELNGTEHDVECLHASPAGG